MHTVLVSDDRAIDAQLVHTCTVFIQQLPQTKQLTITQWPPRVGGKHGNINGDINLSTETYNRFYMGAEERDSIRTPKQDRTSCK